MEKQAAEPRSVGAALRRVVLGWRLFSLLWMSGLTVEVFLSDEEANQAIVAAALALAAVWTALTLWVARDRERFESWLWLVADGVTTAAIALAPLAADSASTFFGGYPLSWVIYVAYFAKQRWLLLGGIAAGVMSATQALDEVVREGSWNIVGEVAVFFVTAWVVGAGMWNLRRNEDLRIEAQERLAEERNARRRADERAELAARLHDSVLQTLPVMRHHAEDPSSVRRLARRVERQLRQFLEGLQSGHDDGLRAAIREAAWDVEDLYEIVIDEVGTGDCPVDDRLRALVAATREALINSAKYSGVAEIDLYTEITGGTARVFVRDRGAGFDTGAGDAGRGIAHSIVGRMTRNGGLASVRSEPGEGTEVELEMPLASGNDG